MGKENGNPFVFLDIKVGNEKVGRVVLELFKDVAPKTVENFRCLCTGERGVCTSGRPLYYKHTIFHKAVSQFIIQGGDVTNFDGSGGESIYGEKFDDETFIIKHDKPGVLSMANAGPNTNSSQFFITTVPCPHLDNINVAFGEVRAGFQVVTEVSGVQTEKDRPIVPCVVENCGELQPGSDWGLAENDGTPDKYPPFPEDWELSTKLKVERVEEVITNIKDSGNYYFSIKNYTDANRKYKKAIRYIDWCKTQSDKINSYDEMKLSEIKLVSLLNQAAVKLKLNLFREALYLCDKGLLIDRKCAKAFYRRGQARIGLNDYEMALKDLKTALLLVPNNKSIKLEIISLRNRMRNYLLLEKVRFEKMLK